MGLAENLKEYEDVLAEADRWLGLDYKIAEVNSKEYEAIKQAEQQVKKETGKDFIMIAWEKK